MTGRPHTAFAAVALALTALGALGALATLAWPVPAAALYPQRPQPTLAGTPAEVVDILAANVSMLALPLLFVGAAGGRPGPWRIAGDLATAAIVAVNSVAVGAALALNGTALLAYLPHLPVEAAALALTCSTWLCQRNHRGPLAKVFLAVVALAAAAALIEVYATPHTAR